MAEITGIRINQLPSYNGGEENKIDEADLEKNYLLIDEPEDVEGSRKISLKTIVNSLEKASIDNIDWTKVTNKPGYLNTIESTLTTMQEDINEVRENIPTRSSEDPVTGDGTYVGAAYVKGLINDSAATTTEDKTWSVKKINEELSAAGKIKSVSAADGDTVIKVNDADGAVTIGHKDDYQTGNVTTGNNGTQAKTSLITFKVPKVTVDKYGHVTTLDETEITIASPATGQAGIVKVGGFLSSPTGYKPCQAYQGVVYAPASPATAKATQTFSTSDTVKTFSATGFTSTMAYEIFTHATSNTSKPVPVTVASIQASSGSVTLTLESAPEEAVEILLVGHEY